MNDASGNVDGHRWHRFERVQIVLRTKTKRNVCEETGTKSITRWIFFRRSASVLLYVLLVSNNTRARRRRYPSSARNTHTWCFHNGHFPFRIPSRPREQQCWRPVPPGRRWRRRRRQNLSPDDGRRREWAVNRCPAFSYVLGRRRAALRAKRETRLCRPLRRRFETRRARSTTAKQSARRHRIPFFFFLFFTCRYWC